MNKRIKKVATLRESSNLKNGENAITLIALVLTIIVLLILSAVTLNMVLGENGLFGKARNAKEETEKAQAIEDIKLKILEVQTDAASEGRTATLENLYTLLQSSAEEYKVETVSAQTSSLTNDSDSFEGTIAKLLIRNTKYTYIVSVGSNLQIENDVQTAQNSNSTNNSNNNNSGNSQQNGENETNNQINSLQFCTTPAGTTSTASVNSPCVVVENYRNNDSWYRVWSDGWIEQGGKATPGTTKNGSKTSFLKNFADTNYCITFSGQITGQNEDLTTMSIRLIQKSTDGFYTNARWVHPDYGDWLTDVFNWYACGY